MDTLLRTTTINKRGCPGTSPAAAVFVCVALVAALVVTLRRPWTRIVVRAAGSWVAATGLLMLGWSLSGRALA
jgi:hypothetical protein